MLKGRFLRSRSKRTDLFLSTNGLCAECHKDLDVGWHSHHHIPWNKGGLTVPENLRPLCPKCNLRKGDKMPTMSATSYEQLEHFNEDFSKASKEVRVCQIGGYNCAIQKLVYEKSLSCSLFLPTGVGKSDVVRMISIGLTNRDFCPGTWVFSPSTDLRRQLKSDDVVKFLDRAGKTYVRSPFIEVDALDTPRWRNDTVLESFTTQFLVSNGNVNQFIQHAQMQKRKTGNCPVAIFDESHLFSTDNHWGTCATLMQEAGIPIILVTGTPYRTDKIRIPGFRTEFLDSSTRSFVKTKKVDDKLEIKKGIIEAKRHRLIADYEYSYSRAWRDNVIIKPEPIFVDATLSAYDKIVSDMSRGESGKMLRTFLLDDRTISSCVETAIKSLRCKKVADPSCAAIVATISDDEEDATNGDSFFSDLHAKKVQREFARQSPSLKILVVTSNQNSENGLETFRKGIYDVIIVKAMGTIGFNHPPLKTVLNLSNHRTLNALIQLANRGCRNFGGISNFDVIMPKDKAMRDLWEQFLEETGLVIEDKTTTVEEEEIVPISEKDKEDKENYKFEKHNVSLEPHVARNINDEIIELFNVKVPKLANKMNNQEKLEHYTSLALVHGNDWLERMPDYTIPETNTVLIDSNDEEYRLRAEANDCVNEITHRMMELSCKPYRTNKHLYGEHTKSVWTCVKRCCGFAAAQSLNNISGIESYKDIIDACESLKDDMMSLTANSDFDYKHYLSSFGR